MSEEPPKVKWGPCCFCGSGIDGTDTDPCRIEVTAATGKWQVWFCHGDCFKQRLTDLPEAPGLFEPAHF